MTAETRTTSSTGGQKAVKLAAFSLVPVRSLWRVAEHFGRGAAKYANHQWRNGYEWSKSYDALMRHALSFWDGEDWDVCPSDCDRPEPRGENEHGLTCFNHIGSHHLDAVMWHGMCLREFYDRFPEHDDRYIYPKGTQ